MLLGSKVAHHILRLRMQEGSSQRVSPAGALKLLGQDLGTWSAGRARHVSEQHPSPPRPAWVTPECSEGAEVGSLNASFSAYLFCVFNQMTWPTYTPASFSIGWTYQILPPVIVVKWGEML